MRVKKEIHQRAQPGSWAGGPWQKSSHRLRDTEKCATETPRHRESLTRVSHSCSTAGELQQEVRRSRAKGLEHSAGAAKRRARPESDRETNRITHRLVRLPVRSGRACRPCVAGRPEECSLRLLLSCSPVLLFSCDCLVAFLFDRMS